MSEKNQERLKKLSYGSAYAGGLISSLNNLSINRKTGKLANKTVLNIFAGHKAKPSKALMGLGLVAATTSLVADIKRSTGLGDFVKKKLSSSAVAFGGSLTGVSIMKGSNKLAGKVKFIRKGGRIIPIKVQK